jgi:glutamine synthetase
MLCAGMAGMREKLELEAAFKGDVYHADGAKETIREVPKTLREATEEFRKSKMLRETLGDKVVDHYTRTAEWEQEEFDRKITSLELMRGFERY